MTTTLKTIADLKRALVPGVSVHTYHHGSALFVPSDLGIRKVLRANSVGVQFATDEGKTSTLYWPKKDQFVPIENGFEIWTGHDALNPHIESRKRLTYRFV